MESRRLIVALLAAFGVYLAYMTVYRWIVPPRPPMPVTSQPAVAPADQPVTQPGNPASNLTPTSTVGTPPTSAQFKLTSAEETAPVILGGDTDLLQLELSSRGASVKRLLLTERVPKSDRFRFRAQIKSNEPCTLLAPIKINDDEFDSFVTSQLWLPLQSNAAIELGNANWKLQAPPQRDATGEHVTFSTAIQSEQGGDLLTLEKTYLLVPGKPLVNMSVTVRNVGPQALSAAIKQDGPVGIEAEDMRYHIRRLLAATQKPGQNLALGASFVRTDLFSKTHTDKAQPDKMTPVAMMSANDPNDLFVWTALCNKYFGVFTRPLPGPDGKPPIVAAVGDLLGVGKAEDLGDMRARLTTRTREIGPGQSTTWSFEIYAGAKDPQYLDDVNIAFADRKQLAYVAAYDVDQGACMCVFHPLPEIMGWLMRTIAGVVGNYGVAILFLVLIIRGLLHPLSVFQQKSMYRMQEGMAKLHPKLEAIKTQFAGDAVKIQQETMKVYAEAGVNPAGMFVGFIPMFIQLPILGALWSELNAEIALRHAPFDGWWIRDLAAPDAFISFPGGLTIPYLSAIPFLGAVFTNIQSLNLLPILMGVSMWLQQKYMPKPEHAKRAPSATGKAGMTPEEQMRQQQMMASMMSIMFPLMFYSQPAGLNMYWMFTTIFGIVESLIIRKQIKAEKEYRLLHGEPPPKSGKPGLIGRFMQNAAKKVEAMRAEMERLQEEEKKKGSRKEERKNDKRR